MKAILQGGPHDGLEVMVGPTTPRAIAMPPHGAYVRQLATDPAVFTWVEWVEEDHGAWLLWKQIGCLIMVASAILTAVGLIALARWITGQ